MKSSVIFFGSLLLLVLGVTLAACDASFPSPLRVADTEEPSSGLDARPVSSTCGASGVITGGVVPSPNRTPDAKIGYTAVSSATFLRAIEVEAKAGRIYVAQQTGALRVVDGPTKAPTVLDISDRISNGYDQGLLGFALHPKFPDTPYVYVTYTAPPPSPPPPNVSFVAVIARFELKSDGVSFDPASEKRILVFDHPGVNHNNDAVLFGPDGYLYIASGEGSDPLEVNYQPAQRKTSLLGKILRIDVDHGDPYVIPPTNPFAGAQDGSRPEIYAYGLRNPWRFNFDSKSGRLWVGDVGHLTWEEIDEIIPGGNYGWGNREGFECFSGGLTCEGSYIDPILVHNHTEAAAIIGGVFYYGTAIPELTGTYVYADAQSSNFWSVSTDLTKTKIPVPTRLDRGLGRLRPVSLRLDEQGEILVVSYLGKLLRLTAPTAPPPSKALAATGCVDANDPRIVAQGLFHYDVNVSQYADGLTVDRQLAIPPNTSVDVDLDTGRLTLPNGSVAMRTLIDPATGLRVETQLLTKSLTGQTKTSTYLWLADGTDASLVSFPSDVTLPSGREHHIDPTTCDTCHSEANGGTLGLELAQLDRDGVTYGPARKGNPLDTLEKLHMLSVPSIDRSSYRRLSPIDGTDTVELRARSYLHANCSFCHHAEPSDPDGLIDLRFRTSLRDTRTCNKTPAEAMHGIYFVPGDPDRSLIVRSMRSTDPTRSPRPMPPVVTSVDTAGADLVAQWIRGTGACP